eukprot:scaffold574_cov190-Amphora_coffeaeformis.AAC.11
MSPQPNEVSPRLTDPLLSSLYLYNMHAAGERMTFTAATTNTQDDNVPAEIQEYISTILGRRDPYTLSSSRAEDDDKDSLLYLLFQADSLWNMGQTTEAQQVLVEYHQKKQQQAPPPHVQWFSQGLQHLCDGSSSPLLAEAYRAFHQAALDSCDVPLL